MQGNYVAKGTVEGTGAAINISCGFVPRVVRVLNIDGICTMDWTDDMGDAYGLKTADSGIGTTDISLVTSLGISAYAGSEAANSAGFTIGADTDLNVSAETLIWVAHR